MMKGAGEEGLGDKQLRVATSDWDTPSPMCLQGRTGGTVCVGEVGGGVGAGSCLPSDPQEAAILGYWLNSRVKSTALCSAQGTPPGCPCLRLGPVFLPTPLGNLPD